MLNDGKELGLLCLRRLFDCKIRNDGTVILFYRLTQFLEALLSHFILFNWYWPMELTLEMELSCISEKV